MALATAPRRPRCTACDQIVAPRVLPEGGPTHRPCPVCRTRGGLVVGERDRLVLECQECGHTAPARSGETR